MQLSFDAFWFSFLSLIIICCVELFAGWKFCSFFLLHRFPVSFYFSTFAKANFAHHQFRMMFCFFKNKCLILWIPYSAKWEKEKKLWNIEANNRNETRTKNEEKNIKKYVCDCDCDCITTPNLKDLKLFCLFLSCYIWFLNVFRWFLLKFKHTDW